MFMLTWGNIFAMKKKNLSSKVDTNYCHRSVLWVTFELITWVTELGWNLLGGFGGNWGFEDFVGVGGWEINRWSTTHEFVSNFFSRFNKSHLKSHTWHVFVWLGFHICIGIILMANTCNVMIPSAASLEVLMIVLTMMDRVQTEKV